VPGVRRSVRHVASVDSTVTQDPDLVRNDHEKWSKLPLTQGREYTHTLSLSFFLPQHKEMNMSALVCVIT
jgi:hypothetical protein